MHLQQDSLQKCLGEIEDHLSWGPASAWTNQDFEELSQRIATSTGTTLSVTTLKRVWGRVAYANQPSTTTLDALVQFVGASSWRDYRATEDSDVAPGETATTADNSPSYWPSWKIPIYLLISLLVIVALGMTFMKDRSFAPAALPPLLLAPEDYSFDLRHVTEGVPNSVIFTYDARAAPSREIYLQQSWDNSRREQLSREGTTHTSIYYLPGYYRAKLIVEDHIVQERELLIASNGWVAAIARDSVPIYLSPGQSVMRGQLAITESNLADYGIPLRPSPPTTLLTNVGMLEGLYTDDFYFRTRLRHGDGTGAAACRQVHVVLLLKNSIIIIPLSAPGCVADLDLMAGGRQVSGRDTDLSAFGVVSDRWVEVVCKGTDQELSFAIDGHEVYSLTSQEERLEIVGVQYLFSGVGAVDEVVFGNEVGEVWRDDF